MKLLIAISLLVLLSTIHPSPTRAAWQLDGLSVSTAINLQTGQQMLSDGAGGTFIVWADYRSSAGDIYVQRVNASGSALWMADGVAVCTAAADQTVPKIVSDGAGGAIVTWKDNRSSNLDVYAQRINASGVVQWAANGVAVCTAANSQINPELVADGSGGAIITWGDFRSGSEYDVYAQRVNAAGAVQWLANGVVISAAASSQSAPVIATDGAGGAIIAWMDFRSGTTNDVYAQRVNGAGAVQWAANGLSICNAANGQSDQAIVADGSGGALIAWLDGRNGIDPNIYVQRVNAAGTSLWLSNGVAVCVADFDQGSLVLVSDGAGGAILSWIDYRFGITDIYAQRMLANSSPYWAYNGVAVCDAPDFQVNPCIVTDGSGGAVVAWSDFRTGISWDVYAQEITASGEAKWGDDGVTVCTAAGDQFSPIVMWDSGTGAVVAWTDNRSGSQDVYAQRLDLRYGYWGRPEPVLVAAKDNPRDQGGKVVLNWQPSGRDVLNQQTIYRYSVWRAIDAVAEEALASSGNAFFIDTPVTKSAPAAARVVWRERAPATTYYWEQIGLQIANYSDAYSFLASTRQDSIAANPATTYFRVVAESGSAFYNWPSNVLSAHSVDNLAPAAPLMLTAQRVGANVNLSWNRAVAPDLRDYSVYRKTSSGVTPVPINFLASSEDTVAVDAGAPATVLYYIVTAYDVHANQSAPSNEASVGATTDIGNTPPITALTVLQNQPNPFAGRTDLRVGLPANSDVSVEVFDVAGRRVRAQTFAQQKAGWQSIPFDARDDGGRSLASGVYFYRITAGGSTVTNKMVIAR